VLRLLASNSLPLTVDSDIFATLICQIAERPKTQSDYLVVERIELTHRRYVEKSVPEQGDISLKRTLRWDHTAKTVSDFCIMDINPIQPITHGFKQIKPGRAGRR
jgi:hypothetical protein